MAEHTTKQATKSDAPRFSCPLCAEGHGLRYCPAFRRMTPAQRSRYAGMQGYCTNCLAMSHGREECPSTGRCTHCGATHHSMLHVPTAAERRQPVGQSRRPRQAGQPRPNGRPRPATGGQQTRRPQPPRPRSTRGRRGATRSQAAPTANVRQGPRGGLETPRYRDRTSLGLLGELLSRLTQ